MSVVKDLGHFNPTLNCQGSN